MELIAEGLTKRYGDVPALTGVSLRAGPGVLAVLGPNGSGKTTLLRILATALRPDAGRASFAGRDYAADPARCAAASATCRRRSTCRAISRRAGSSIT